jgi:hypothetical protein
LYWGPDLATYWFLVPGNFSFGSFTKFKSNTIVEFIENAVEHSRSGRYLFFLHRRPVRPLVSPEELLYLVLEEKENLALSEKERRMGKILSTKGEITGEK